MGRVCQKSSGEQRETSYAVLNVIYAVVYYTNGIEVMIGRDKDSVGVTCSYLSVLSDALEKFYYHQNENKNRRFIMASVDYAWSIEPGQELTVSEADPSDVFLRIISR